MLTALYDAARDNEAPGTTVASMEHIDWLWPLPTTGRFISFQQFLREHNQNRKSAILSGSKWNPRPPRRSDNSICGMEKVDLCHDVQNQADDSSMLLLLGGCSQQICMAAGMDPYDDGDNNSLLSTPGAAAEEDDRDECFNQRQEQSSQIVTGRNVYSSNLSLFAQVANLAEGNAGLAREVRKGLEHLLSKFLEQKNKGVNASEHEFASLPHVDSSRRNKRLRPVLSPEKRSTGNRKKY